MTVRTSLAAAAGISVWLAAGAVQAQAPRPWTAEDPEGRRGQFQFLGQRIGDPITKAFPDPKNQKDQFGLLLCRGVTFIPGFTDCEDHSLRKIVDGVPRLDYQGVEVKFVNLRYLNDKFIGFTMAFDSDKFVQLVAVAKRQYGPPFATETARWKDRLGLPFDNTILSWNTPHGVMTLKQRAVAVDSGTFELMESAAERRYHDVRYRQVVD